MLRPLVLLASLAAILLVVATVPHVSVAAEDCGHAAHMDVSPAVPYTSLTKVQSTPMLVADHRPIMTMLHDGPAPAIHSSISTLHNPIDAITVLRL